MKKKSASGQLMLCMTSLSQNLQVSFSAFTTNSLATYFCHDCS